MKIVKTALIVMLLVTACSCRRKDVRTVTVDVPEMKNKACSVIVINSIINEMTRGDRNAAQRMASNGDVKVDLGNRTVIVKYESLQTAIKNIEHAIANAGFSAFALTKDGERTAGVPANVEAVKKLPPECKR